MSIAAQLQSLDRSIVDARARVNKLLRYRESLIERGDLLGASRRPPAVRVLRSPPRTPSPLAERLVALAADRMELDANRIWADDRHRRPTAARQMIFHTLYRHGWLKCEIARCMGRDHSTICHALSRPLPTDDPWYRQIYAELAQLAPPRREEVAAA